MYSPKSVSTASMPRAPCIWAVPFFALAVPWYDLTSVVLLRLWQGRSPFHADKQHLSHRLVELGMSSPIAVGVIYLLTLASGAGGLVLYALDDRQALLLLGGQFGCWWVVIAAIELGVRARRSAAGGKE